MQGEMKTSSLIFLAVVLCVVAGVLLFISEAGRSHRVKSVTSFEECKAAGNPIMESYPEQCRTPDGKLFVNPAQHVDVPTNVATTTTGYVGDGCVIGGCSKEICAESSGDPIISSCVYLPQFACYKTARCEKQTDGTCGWTQTPELRTCLDSSVPTTVQPLSD